MKYRNVSLPRGLVDEVEAALPGGHYASVAEFVKEAIRDKLPEKA